MVTDQSHQCGIFTQIQRSELIAVAVQYLQGCIITQVKRCQLVVFTVYMGYLAVNSYGLRTEGICSQRVEISYSLYSLPSIIQI